VKLAQLLIFLHNLPGLIVIGEILQLWLNCVLQEVSFSQKRLETTLFEKG